MNYFLALLAQIAIYHGAGMLVFSVVDPQGNKAHGHFALCQLTGVLLVSAYLVALTTCDIPRTRAMLIPFFACLAALSVLRNWRHAKQGFGVRIGFGSRCRVSHADAFFYILVLLLGAFWLAIAFVNTFNLVPPGDGYSWVGISLKWAYQTPFIPSDRPPLTNVAEALHFMLLQGQDMNGALLATWWLHILALVIIGQMMRVLTNRWVAVLLVSALSLSQPFVHNIILGYRDALVAKWVVATMLGGIVFASRRDGPRDAMMLGLMFSATALIKHEGFLCGGIVFGIAVIVAMALRWREAKGRLHWHGAFALIPPLVLIGGWWLVRLYGLQGENSTLIRDFNTLAVDQFILQFVDQTRFRIVWAGLMQFVIEPLYGLTVIALLAGTFSRATRLQCLMASAGLILSIAFVFTTYMATPLDLSYHLNTSLGRLMFTPWALAVAAVCISLSIKPFTNPRTETSRSSAA